MTRQLDTTPTRTTANDDLRDTELTMDHLGLVVGGLRKSAGGSASGVMFLRFEFKLN
jgi:hypothetical protein